MGLEGYLVLRDLNINHAIVYSTRSDGQNWNFEIDNLKFINAISTPEPASLLLIGVSLAAMAACRRFTPSK